MHDTLPLGGVIMNIEKDFEYGKIITDSISELAEKVDFVPHKLFTGVSLKLLVSGSKTNNMLSLHLVRVEPQCCLESHAHPDNLEMHKVIKGDGTVNIGDHWEEYQAGTVGVIPMGTKHEVTAGKNGLYILATFSPALA